MTQDMYDKHYPIPEIEPDLAKEEEAPTIPPFAAEKIWDECKKRAYYRKWMNYRLGDHLGSGSFASTYKITDPYGKYAYCIKIAKDSSANDTEKDVYNSFKAIPNVIEYAAKPEDIVHTFRTDESGSILAPTSSGGTYKAFKFCVYLMRLYDSSLAALKASQTQLSEERIIKLGIDISKALAGIHSAGYIHTDVKPGNILIHNRTGEEHPRFILTDFNSVAHRRREGSLTNTPERALAITFDFADPCLDTTVRTPKYDLYGLAATMYWLANKYTIQRLVYDSFDETKLEITTIFTYGLNKILLNRSRPKGISDGLWRILSKAMDCNLQNRYQTAGAFCDALERLLARKQEAAGNETDIVSAPVKTSEKESPKKERKLPSLGEIIYVIVLLGGLFLYLSSLGYLIPGIPQNIAGYAYKEGIFVKENPEKSIYWYTTGTELENANCAYVLGHCYEVGDMVEQDADRAEYFYSLAVEYGHEEAPEKLRNLQEQDAIEEDSNTPPDESHSAVERPATENRNVVEAATFDTPNGDSATYLQVLEPAQQDFFCEFLEVPDTPQINWNKFKYSFDEATGELSLNLSYNRNKNIYETLCALISDKAITEEEIADAITFYPEIWASQLSSGTELQTDVILGMPLDDWSSDDAYLLFLCMDKNFDVVSHIIVKANNIPINGIPSDWVEIEGRLHHRNGVDLNINYALCAESGAEIVISYCDETENSWTVIDDLAFTIDQQGTGKTWLRVDSNEFPENAQLKAYLFPLEHGDTWSPLASSQPVDSHL